MLSEPLENSYYELGVGDVRYRYLILEVIETLEARYYLTCTVNEDVRGDDEIEDLYSIMFYSESEFMKGMKRVSHIDISGFVNF